MFPLISNSPSTLFNPPTSVVDTLSIIALFFLEGWRKAGVVYLHWSIESSADFFQNTKVTTDKRKIYKSSGFYRILIYRCLRYNTLQDTSENRPITFPLRSLYATWSIFNSVKHLKREKRDMWRCSLFSPFTLTITWSIVMIARLVLCSLYSKNTTDLKKIS